MDLGFGQGNQTVGQAAAQAIEQVAKAQAEVLDQEMAKYDALLEDDQALEALRNRRLGQMKKAQQNKSKWLSLGHGVYSEFGSGQDTRDVARDFFEAAKQSERMVVHFYRPTTPLCDIFHKHLQLLAPKHLETRFVKINVEGADGSRGSGGASSFLVDKLGIRVMPTLVIVKNRKVEHHLRGFDELGATEEFSTEALAHVLGTYGGLIRTEEEEHPPEMDISSLGVNRIQIKDGKHRMSLDDDDF
mmetsp:Transcript_19852/g.25564  ORF Transcript_19852/g.25564 Transcript_19852/m.25564 type:complete len:245 (+) Transcript_19852:48-782(+)|eukprot:CAMPEP_0198141298 /NCGR_PEP_ID=MMETSP1443-20131203/4334_1 /TAXON_ID=186043 /ORGANISM="Entomoneis sp., Strain CCMP2396" /LENGTH=244 /DNA_ID=CAMNT_0043804015 /DNA_START=35 /DNA_END=769 /DNA_ORIENTATION=+